FDPCRLVRQVKQFRAREGRPLAVELLHLPHKAAGVVGFCNDPVPFTRAFGAVLPLRPSFSKKWPRLAPTARRGASSWGTLERQGSRPCKRIAGTKGGAMNATLKYLATFLGLVMAVPMAQAEGPRAYGQAPDACGPGYYNAGPCGMVYGPNYCLYPCFPPWQFPVF